MTLIVIAGILVILGMNMFSAFDFSPTKYISPNDVRGSAIQYNQKLYTLNFEQQNNLLGIFNSSTVIPEASIANGMKPEFDKIILYRFNAPDVSITPIQFLKKGDQHVFIYSAPTWNASGWLQATGPENFQNFFSQTYDH